MRGRYLFLMLFTLIFLTQCAYLEGRKAQTTASPTSQLNKGNEVASDGLPPPPEPKPNPDAIAAKLIAPVTQ